MRDLARYLFQSGHYSASKAVVKPNAFLPRGGETSVFDIAGLDQDDIRRIGDDVGAARGGAPKGRGEFDYADVKEVGLRFERDDVPPRHGNLVGWPSEGPELKARAKAIAVGLSARAVLVLHDV